MKTNKPGWLRYEINEYGVQRSVHFCGHCGTEYSVTPAFPPEETREVSRMCTRPSCSSYRPSLDLDLMMFGVTHDNGVEKPGAVEYLASIAHVPRPTLVALSTSSVGEEGN